MRLRGRKSKEKQGGPRVKSAWASSTEGPLCLAKEETEREQKKNKHKPNHKAIKKKNKPSITETSGFRAGNGGGGVWTR